MFNEQQDRFLPYPFNTLQTIVDRLREMTKKDGQVLTCLDDLENTTVTTTDKFGTKPIKLEDVTEGHCININGPMHDGNTAEPITEQVSGVVGFVHREFNDAFELTVIDCPGHLIINIDVFRQMEMDRTTEKFYGDDPNHGQAQEQYCVNLECDSIQEQYEELDR